MTNKKTYTMVTKASEGIYFRRFTFNASNQDEASDKAYNWARYQGMDARDVTAEPANESELNWATNNEWVSS